MKSPLKRVPFTPAMQNELKTLKEKTGWGSRKLFHYGQTQKLHPVFSRKSFGLLEGWLKNPPQTISEDQYNAIMEAYRSIPEGLHIRERANNLKGEIPVSDELRVRLQRLLDQKSQLTPRKMLKMYNAPKKLSEIKIYKVAKGSCATLTPEHHSFIINVLDLYKIR